MTSLKLLAVILIVVIGLNFIFPEKSAEFREKVYEAVKDILNRAPVIGSSISSTETDIQDLLDNLPKTAEIVKKKIERAQEVLITPSPLRIEKEQVPAYDVVLTEAGIVSWTNRSRLENNVLSLNINTELSAAAKLKLDDIFRQQYFAHISPSGAGPADLSKKAGYEYILVGENLALGNFKDDQNLVEAWMDSPGHRENILNERFTEIGVAVSKGFFDGRETWIAVQEFGLPLSSCPSPSEELLNQIKSDQDRLSDFLAELERRKEEIDSTKQGSPEYNEKVNAYNERVASYNKLLHTTRKSIEDYNSGVKEFNKCLEG